MTDRFETKPGVRLPQPEDKRPRRFYKEVTAGQANPALGEGFAVLLDGRPVRTPAKKVLLLPTPKLAADIGREWGDQGERIDPAHMPLTRLAFVTLDREDRVTPQVIEEVARYAETDLVCYRADAPAALAEAQSVAWDRPLEWARRRLGVEFSVTKGMFPIGQPPEAVEAVRSYAGKLDPWRLTALAHATALTGSALIGLMLLEEELEASEAHALSTVDERFQASQWGEDHEAAERMVRLVADIDAAAHFIAALRT